MSNITVKEFDEVMLTVVKRQIELKSDYTPEEIVKIVLKNARDKNYKGITRRCIPFFQSINVESVLKSLTGYDFEKAIDVYAKRINMLLNQKQIINKEDERLDVNYIINANVLDVEQVKQMLKGYSKDEMIAILEQAYKFNDSFSKLIDQGHYYLLRNKTSIIGNDINSKVRNFITYIENYDLYQNNIYLDHINASKKNLDDFLKSDLPYEQKVKFLTDIYYGNYNPMLSSLPFSITKQEIIVLLLKNLSEFGITSTNVNGLDYNEKILYYGLNPKQIDQALGLVNDNFNKLLASDVNKSFVRVTPKGILEHLESMDYQEINALINLYVVGRRNDDTIRVLESSFDRRYNLNEHNKIRYSNISSLYNCVTSKQFMDFLSDKSYHM